jgi:flagellin
MRYFNEGVHFSEERNMGLVINTNLPALAVNRHMTTATADIGKSYARIASGQRITNAGDDAAGLAISENLRAQIRSMGQAERNSNDGISFVQVAEGGLNEISNIMIRLRELGIQAGSDTVGDRERGYINQEAQTLLQEVDRIANVTSYNGTPLLNGEAPKSRLEFQVGIYNSENDRITFDAGNIDARTSNLGIDGLNYESSDDARDALEKVDDAMAKIFSGRAALGAMQSRLQSTVRNLGVVKENFTIARSRIADTDIASETSELVRGNILQAAGISVLAQANSNPTQALKLI